MNKKIFGLAFLLAAVLETTFLNAMDDFAESQPGGRGRSKTPPPTPSLYDQGWFPGAPCRTDRDRTIAQERAKKDPNHCRWVNGSLWIKA